MLASLSFLLSLIADGSSCSMNMYQSQEYAILQILFS